MCSSQDDARGLHGLSCRKSYPRHIRHSLINDILRKAQVPTRKEHAELSSSDGKPPDGATLIPWTQGQPLAWNVTVSDTFAQSQIMETLLMQRHHLTRQLVPKSTNTSISSEAIELTNNIEKEITAINLEQLPVWKNFHRSPEMQCPGVSKHIPK